MCMLSHVWLFCDPVDFRPPSLFCLWVSPGKNTTVGCHLLLQGDLPDPGIKPGSPALQANSLPKSEPLGKPMVRTVSQFNSVAESCPTLCYLINRSTPGLPVHHRLPEFTKTHVHRVSDAIQPSHPLPSPSPLAPNPSHHRSLFQWVNSLHEVAKLLEFQL